MASDLAKWDGTAYAPAAWTAASITCNTLVGYPATRATLTELELRPELAATYEVAEDGSRYSFTLREGLRFSDGSPVTAADVEGSFLRLLDPAAAFDALGTPYYDAIERVVREVFREPARGEMRGRRALVALTDGVDSTSDAEFAEVRAEFLASGSLSYFIQVNTEEYVENRLMQDCQDDGRLSLSRVQLQRYRRIFNPHADAADYADFCGLGPFERMSISRALYQLARREMTDLARASGGKAFTALDLRDARQAFAQIAAEIGRQYSLGYYSTNKARDGSFRKIRVELRGAGPGAQISAREGYQAPRS